MFPSIKNGAIYFSLFRIFCIISSIDFRFRLVIFGYFFEFFYGFFQYFGYFFGGYIFSCSDWFCFIAGVFWGCCFFLFAKAEEAEATQEYDGHDDVYCDLCGLAVTGEGGYDGHAEDGPEVGYDVADGGNPYVLGFFHGEAEEDTQKSGIDKLYGVTMIDTEAQGAEQDTGYGAKLIADTHHNETAKYEFFSNGREHSDYNHHNDDILPLIDLCFDL